MPAERQVGVEEEMFLVDPRTRLLLATSERTVEVAGGSLVQELFLEQIETQSEPHLDMTDLLADLRASRQLAARAALQTGAHVAAMPTPVLAGDAGSVTHKERYQRMVLRYGLIGRRSMACGMHVHVDVTDDEEGVAVIDRLAPWLPVVLALSANSPFNLGVDTDYASWRAEIWESWPTAGAPEPFGDAASYHRAVTDLIDSGAAFDEGMIYFDARLARNFPTIEIRVADVCTDPEVAVVIAAVLRGLVDMCAQEWRDGSTSMPWRGERLRAARWHARRDALTGSLMDPADGRLAPARHALDTLVRRIGPALDQHGDRELVEDGIARLLREGTGAERQRQVAGEGLDLPAVVDDVLERTLRPR